MNPAEQKQLTARLRRIAGQVRALELQLGKDPETVTTQLLATIASLKASLRFYIEKQLLARNELTVKERALLARLINRSG